MILQSMTKYATHLDPYKMMSSNIAKKCHQQHDDEPAICDVDQPQSTANFLYLFVIV